MALAWRGSETVETRTDPNGRAQVPAGALVPPTCADGSWTIVPGPEVRGEPKSAELRDVWCYSEIRVCAQVIVANGGAVPAETVVDTVNIGRAGDCIGNRVDPWTLEWLEPARVATVGSAVRCAPDGRVTVNVPGIAGVALRASARGYRVGIARVPIPHDPMSVVTVELRPAVRVAGRCVGDDGVPLRRIPVRVSASRVLPLAEVNELELRWQGQGVTIGASQAQGRAAVTVAMVVSTDDEGRFDVSMANDGPYTVTAWAKSHAAAQRIISADVDDVTAIELAATRAGGQTLSLTRDGQPVCGAQCSICDVSGGSISEQIPLPIMYTNAAGAIESSWLTTGRRYRFAVGHGAGRVVGFVTWRGQKSIDIGRDLSRDMAE